MKLISLAFTYVVNTFSFKGLLSGYYTRHIYQEEFLSKHVKRDSATHFGLKKNKNNGLDL